MVYAVISEVHWRKRS